MNYICISENKPAIIGGKGLIEYRKPRKWCMAVLRIILALTTHNCDRSWRRK